MRKKEVAALVAAALRTRERGVGLNVGAGQGRTSAAAATKPPKNLFVLSGFHCAFDVPEAPVSCISWAPRRADLVAISGGSGSVFVYSVPAATDAGGGVSGVKLVHVLDGGHAGRAALFLDWGADGRTLVSCAPGPLPGGGRMTQWDVDSGRALRAVDVARDYGLSKCGTVVGCRLHPDRSANLAALAFSEGVIAMVDLNVTGSRGVRSTATFSERKRPLTCLGVDAANARLVVGDARGGVHLVGYTRREGTLERGASLTRGASVLRVETLALSPACGGAPLVLASRGDGTLTLFRVGDDGDAEPTAAATPPPKRGGLLGGLLPMDVTAEPGLSRLADVAFAEGGGVVPAAFCRMLGLVAGPEQQRGRASAEYLAVGDTHGCIQVLGVSLAGSKGGEAPRPPQRLEGHASPVAALAWSPDDALLATAGLDGSVLIWRTAT